MLSSCLPLQDALRRSRLRLTACCSAFCADAHPKLMPVSLCVPGRGNAIAGSGHSLSPGDRRPPNMLQLSAPI
jgi:hypothetical protein